MGEHPVMEFIEGQDRQEQLDQSSRPLLETQVFPWILQVYDALNYLHYAYHPLLIVTYFSRVVSFSS